MLITEWDPLQMWLLYNKYNLFFTTTNVISFLASLILSLFKDKDWLLKIHLQILRKLGKSVPWIYQNES